MSNKINDGGPAFPVPDSHHANGQVHYGSNGMSLRDWFAGHCPLKFEDSANSYGFLSIEKILMQDDHREAFFQFDAEARMEWADAMLAAREEGGK